MVFDHTSVLKLIEWRWHLAPVTARDASLDVSNLAYVMDFNHTDLADPNLHKPPAPPVGQPCLQTLVVLS